MLKFANKKKIGGLFAALICFVAVVGASVSSAFAYKPSYDEYRTGSNNYGVYQRRGDTPLAVKELKLTYNITDFPVVGDSSDINYRSTLTMEYTLCNPKSEAVTAQLLLPETDKPNYFFENADVTPQITVNGEHVELSTRYVNYYAVDSKAIELSDKFNSDAFFDPDMPVSMFKVTSDSATYAILKGDIITDLTKARYIADGYNEFECTYSKDGASCFYILGDVSAVDFSKISFYNFNRYNLEKIDDKFNIELAETITLRELISRYVGDPNGVNEVDYYNAMLSRFSNTECVCSVSDLSVHNLRKLYAYTVEIPSGCEITTAVTLPVYPDVYSSDRCYYYLSSQSTSSWGAFGKFEVEIVTEKYIYNYVNDFKKTPTGYNAAYGVAPDSVCFSLSTQNNGTYNYVGGTVENTPLDTAFQVVLVIFLVMIIALPVLGGGISFIVLMVKKNKQS